MTCEHIRSSHDGTQWCALAETGQGVYAEIRAELDRADGLHGDPEREFWVWQDAALDIDIEYLRVHALHAIEGEYLSHFAILFEEVLEAREELDHGNIRAARAELIQVAAMCVKTIRAIDRQDAFRASAEQAAQDFREGKGEVR